MRTLGQTPANVALPINSYVGSVDPTVNDDSTKGFDVGSMWITSGNKKVWVCTGNALGAAVWKPLGILGPLGNYTATVAPTANDDSSKGYSAGSLWMTVAGGFSVCRDATPGLAVWLKLK